MTLLKSLFLGRPGDYRVGDIPISIYRQGDHYKTIIDRLGEAIRKMNESKGIISNIKPSSIEPSSKLISLNSATALLSQQYFYTFIHEMGHAVAIKTFKKTEQPKISVYLEEDDTSFFTFQGSVGGKTNYIENPNPNWKDSIVLASGPLSECVISGAQCLAIAALGHYLPSIVAKTMYLFVAAPFIGRSVNSVICVGEKSDFSKIKKISYKDLAIATALIAGNLFVVIALGRKINPEVSF